MSPASEEVFDLFVIGGGINGVGVARDAAGRGLRVGLCDAGDLGGATSSASSKLIHGGLRYLEHYEFLLVKESLTERKLLLKNAPHLVRPLRFILPHVPALRPRWMIRTGLFLYDHLQIRKQLPGSGAIKLQTEMEDCPLKQDYVDGFYYSDCAVDDSRLVITVAVDAARRGAEIYPVTRCLGGRRDREVWVLALQDHRGSRSVRSRAVANITGPWVNRVSKKLTGRASRKALRLVKGSHIVVPRIHNGEDAFLLQNADNRLVFVLPFENRTTLVGTTEAEFEGDPRTVGISPEETDYLCAAVNRYFSYPISAQEVLWSFAGVRPLWDDRSVSASDVTRDYALDLDTGNGLPPLLSVYGGKLTTFRSLAEKVLKALAPWLPAQGKPWTAKAVLPGGNLPGGSREAYVNRLLEGRPWLEKNLAARYANAYGTLSETLLDEARSMADLGRHFGCGLYQREVQYLIDHEWAGTKEDVLWRRSKLGLCFSDRETGELDNWLVDRDQ